MPHRSVVIHGHYYQPPREDPWLEEVNVEATAAPFHDWNARIEYECYRVIVAARVLDRQGRIERVMNTLAYTSFDFGPTLFEWMERAAPGTYAAVLEADRVSAARLGHGNAMAQPYHHVILPLASRRDKVTEVRWGIADFRRRFGRSPEGMWLPETAVDDETLDVLAEHGIRFTVLAPHQVTGAPADGAPGLYRTANGREIALFAYDGGVSHGIAFGGLLRDSQHWADLMAGDAPANGEQPAPSLISAATDGETYGHHHKFGDMALAAVLDALSNRPHVRVENYASFLARHPATVPVQLVAPSAWSCAHGVERWRSDCGCRMVGSTNQRWRAPLRAAVEGLAAELHALFEREGSQFFRDVWAVRDWYGEQPDGPPGAGVDELPVRARELLEMERGALRMATSCAWFFDDIGGLEPLQVMRYAAHAVDLAGPPGRAMEQRFMAQLSEAHSNDMALGTGHAIYAKRVRAPLPHTVRAAAGYAVVRRFGAPVEAGQAFCCAMQDDAGVVTLRERRTGRRHAFEVVVDVPGATSATPPTPMSVPVVRVPAAIEGLEDTGSPLATRGVPQRPEPRIMRRADADQRALTVLVRPVGDGTDAADAPLGVALKLPDLPERARHAVELVMRRERVRRLLTPEDLERLAAGDAQLHELAAAALGAAVRALAIDLSTAAIGRVLGLADLVDALGHGAPFDAQSAFYAVWQAASPAAAERLAPVARRLGFSERALAAARPAPPPGATVP
jgi:hypothetical protein